MNAMRYPAVAALTGLALCAACVQGPGSPATLKNPWGYAVPDAEAERTIRIGPETRWVNVTRLETVRFVIEQGSAQESFTWRFDALPLRPFSLNEIAPAGVLGQPEVTVYVARNRHLDGGGRRSSGSGR